MAVPFLARYNTRQGREVIMANTESLFWPNMFDVSRNKISVATDSQSIVNRVKLLLLTDPTELYMSPTYGVGLKKYLYTYNNDNTIALIKDNIIQQLRLWEPCVIPEKTEVQRGLLYTGEAEGMQDPNHLKLTVTLVSKYGDKLTVEV